MRHRAPNRTPDMQISGHKSKARRVLTLQSRRMAYAPDFRPDHGHLLDDHLRLADRGGVDQHAVQRRRAGAGAVCVLHGGEDRLGALELLLRRCEDRVAEFDLARMDRPFAFAAEDRGAVGLGAEAVGILVIAERPVDGDEAMRPRRLNEPKQRIVPEVVPVPLARACCVLVGQHHIVGVAAADIRRAHALRRRVIRRAEMQRLHAL